MDALKYNAKHQPVTPLPWNMQDGGRSNLAHVEREEDGTQVCSIPKARVGDAAYIQHAANNYPKLVEFLRVVAGNTTDKGATKQMMEDYARELLREAGEWE